MVEIRVIRCVQGGQVEDQVAFEDGAKGRTKECGASRADGGLSAVVRGMGDEPGGQAERGKEGQDPAEAATEGQRVWLFAVQRVKFGPLRMVYGPGWVRDMADFRLIWIPSLQVNAPEVVSRIMAHQQNKGPKTQAY